MNACDYDDNYCENEQRFWIRSLRVVSKTLMTRKIHKNIDDGYKQCSSPNRYWRVLESKMFSSFIVMSVEIDFQVIAIIPRSSDSPTRDTLALRLRSGQSPCQSVGSPSPHTFPLITRIRLPRVQHTYTCTYSTLIHVQQLHVCRMFIPPNYTIYKQSIIC